MSAVIETERLTKRYGAERGIDDVSVRVAAGEIFGFLGPNGAGKTTMIRLLLGLLRPTSGTARLFGLDSRRDGLAIRARVGNLPSDFGYDPRTTGRELLELLAAVRGLAGLGRSRELAERLRADLERPLGQLSRGSRQKVGLIQALFHEPELLICDEPTAGLDPLVQSEFLDLVAEERARGRTVFLSSHRLDEVARVCDRVGVVKDGRLAAVGDVPALGAKGARRVSIRFADSYDPAEFASLPGVSNVRARGQTITFSAVDGVDPIIKAAARHSVTDVDLGRPGLEAAFLELYEREPA